MNQKRAIFILRELHYRKTEGRSSIFAKNFRHKSLSQFGVDPFKMSASVLIYWHLEKTWSVQSVNTIVEPKKDYGEIYKRGDIVRARFSGGTYSGLVVQVSKNREQLKEMGAVVDRITSSHGEGELLPEEMILALKMEEMSANLEQPAGKPLSADLEATEQNKTLEEAAALQQETVQDTAKILLTKSRNGTPAKTEYPKEASKTKASVINSRKRPALLSSIHLFDDDDIPNTVEKSPSITKSPSMTTDKLKEDYVTRKEFRDLVKKVSALKERVKDLEKEKNGIPDRSAASCVSPLASSSPSPSQSPAANLPLPSVDVSCESNICDQSVANCTVNLYNGKTFQQLEDSVCHLDNVYLCTHNLLLQMFSIDYILTHSITGQAANSSTAPKPKFDSRLYDAMASIVQKKFPRISKSDLTRKVQAVQKKYHLKQNKAQ